MGRYRKPLPPGSPYITPAGEQQLREELHQLWKVERPKVTDAVHEAAKNGDRSENGDYIYGKRRLREIDRRVAYLQKRLDQLTVVDQPPANQNKIYFGATITLLKNDQETLRYRIVGSDEFDLSKNLLSVDSPLARQLLGKEVDDSFEFELNEQSTEYTITQIEYE